MANDYTPPEVHVYEADLSDEHLCELRETGDLRVEWEPHAPTPPPDRIEVHLHYSGDGEVGGDAFRVSEPLE